MRRGLVTQVAVRAARVIVRALVVPVADHTRGKDQQRDQRQRNAENPERLLHQYVGSIQNQGRGPLEDSNWM